MVVKILPLQKELLTFEQLRFTFGFIRTCSEEVEHPPRPSSMGEASSKDAPMSNLQKLSLNIEQEHIWNLL